MSNFNVDPMDEDTGDGLRVVGLVVLGALLVVIAVMCFAVGWWTRTD